MDKDKALKLALEALECALSDDKPYIVKSKEAITAIKQARSAPVQEPVWIQPDHLQKAQKAPFLCRVEPNKRDDFVPLYTTPPAQPAPVQVSPLEFVTMVMEKEHLVGKPLFWAEWPNKENT